MSGMEFENTRNHDGAIEPKQHVGPVATSKQYGGKLFTGRLQANAFLRMGVLEVECIDPDRDFPHNRRQEGHVRQEDLHGELH